MGSPVDGIGFEIPDIATHLQRARDEVQRNLVAGSNDRSQDEQQLRQTRSDVADRVREFTPEPALLDRFSRAWNEYGEAGGEPIAGGSTPTSVAAANQQWDAAVAVCEFHLDQFRAARSLYEANERKLFGRRGEPPRLPDEFRLNLWSMRAVLDALPSLQATEIEREVKAASDRFSAEARVRAATRDAAQQAVLADVGVEVSVAANLLGTSGLDWPSLLTQDWLSPQWIDSRTRLGTFDVALPGSQWGHVPCVIPFPGTRSLAIEATATHRELALSLARSLILRVLANTPAGKTEITFIDPLAIGGSVADFLHLGDFDPRLVDTRPRTSQAEIETRLTEHAAHLETVISKYLRGQFQSIEEYNRSAGEMAEAFRLLVVFDFPTQFSDRAAEQLLSIIENGPRCGIVTLLVFDPDRQAVHGPSYDKLLASMDVLRWKGNRVEARVNGQLLPLDVVPDQCPPLTFDAAARPQSPGAQLLASIGSAARRTDQVVVDFDRTFHVLDGLIQGGLANRLPVLIPGAKPVVPARPETWWSCTSASGATAPIGRSGAQDVASLYFSSTDIAGGALMIGLPRSGKTTSLHAAILSMCMIYSPDELELYLIDAKHGVEFNSYRELPHARMVAINREREFAVAVLQSLDKEIERRADLMKREAPGRTNIQEYRLATGAKLPRIVVFIDEFHEVFEEDDRVGQAAFDAFSNIVRQGPFAGVHLVLASQTLTSMPAMDRSTLMLLPTRVAFPCNDSDAQIVLGDDNPDARFLERAGDGILNPNRGNPTHNQRFRGVFVGPDDRAAIVRSIISKAASEGYERRPRVFDGDALASREGVDSRDFFAAEDRPHRLRSLIGEALALDSKLSIVFRRDQDANLLVIAPNDDEGIPAAGGVGVLHSLLLAASTQLERVEILDFLNDEGHPGSLDLETFAERLGVNYCRRQRSSAVIRELARVVAERVALEDYKSAGVLLVVSGIGRASDLDPDAYAHDDDEEPLVSALQRVLREGPEVGIHVAVLAESASALQRRLGTAALDDFGLRVAGQLRGDTERQVVLEDFRGLEVRGSQMVLFDRRTERRTKFQPFGPIAAEWLELASLEARLLTPDNREETPS
ncbi:MAG TPA: FtsK/SpoIIIE domain-containing protein [Ilumatobacteraceae bacterium]|nr:FtsK/SpoIIIE domain-containing protein [Ilumatobacteraceae bacterium]